MNIVTSVLLGPIIIFIIVIAFFIFHKTDDEPIQKNKKSSLIIKQKPKKKITKRYKKNKHKTKNNDILFMDVGVNGEKIGRIVIELFSDVVPHTCKNFRTLCTTKKYAGSPFHRIINDFMIQGGDFTNGNGSGGMSIYGEKFADENFDIPHDRPYLLSMANSGRDTNGSQFFITTAETPHLDGKHVVFGEVIKGHNLIDELNNIETDENDRPVDDVIIMDCGIL